MLLEVDESERFDLMKLCCRKTLEMQLRFR